VDAEADEVGAGSCWAPGGEVAVGAAEAAAVAAAETACAVVEVDEEDSGGAAAGDPVVGFNEDMLTLPSALDWPLAFPGAAGSSCTRELLPADEDGI
jgi:hypothetical protein